MPSLVFLSSSSVRGGPASQLFLDQRDFPCLTSGPGLFFPCVGGGVDEKKIKGKAGY